MAMGSRRRIAVIGLGAAIALTTSGCLQNPNEGGAGGEGLNGYVDNSKADGDKVVEVLGAFGGAEEEAFNASMAAFEEESGIDVKYTADSDFTTTVKTKVNSGDAPDIGLFPQPGGLLELAGDGYAQPINTYLDFDALDRSLVPGFLESARLNGVVYGAPMRMAVKSIVWYPKPAWEAAGYPTEFKSVQELNAFAEELKSKGETPWCMGWESDQATGWVGTDWVEELVLRIGGPDVYDDWIYHRIPFDDDVVVEAMDAFGEVAKTDGNVLGGARAILSKPFSEAMLPAFEDKPQRWMERQGNFATGFYPADVQENLDEEVGIFVYPPYEGGYQGQPILGGGDIAALFNGNDEDAQAVAEYMTSPEFGGEWAKAGGWLSPHTTFDQSNYPNETTKKIAEIAYTSDVFRYDGSDVMVKSVGSGTFWTEMVRWMQGESSADTAAAIEASWPTEEEE